MTRKDIAKLVNCHDIPLKKPYKYQMEKVLQKKIPARIAANRNLNKQINYGKYTIISAFSLSLSFSSRS